MLASTVMELHVDVAMDRLNSCAKGLLKTGAPSFKNQDGSASRPVAVGRRRSRALKTCHSVMYSLSRWTNASG